METTKTIERIFTKNEGHRNRIAPSVVIVVLFISVLLFPVSMNTGAVPTVNDEAWNTQWNVKQINVDDAWDLLESSEPINTGNTDIIVAVISTGVVDTDDLDFWVNIDEARTGTEEDDKRDWQPCDLPYGTDGLPGYPEKDDEGDGYYDWFDPQVQRLGMDVMRYDNDENGYIGDLWGWDFVEDVSGGDPEKDGHFIHDYPIRTHTNWPVGTEIGYGTRIASIISSTFGNNARFAGICPLFVMSLRVLDQETDFMITTPGEKYRCTMATEYAIDNGADIIIFDFISNSDNWMDSEIDLAFQRDIVMVAPTGDMLYDSGGNNYYFPPGLVGLPYPASSEKVIAVGATLNEIIQPPSSPGQPKVAPYSIKGSGIDVVAPGGEGFDEYDNLYMDSHNILTEAQTGPHVRFFGTTDAAAHVGGLCALILSYHPSLSPGEVMEIVRASTRDLIDPSPSPEYGAGYDIYTGWGEIDARKALEMANYFRTDWLGDKFVRNAEFGDGEGHQPAMALDSKGSTHVVWTEVVAQIPPNPQTPAELFYAEIKPNGQIDHGPMPLEGPITIMTETTYPDIIIDNKDYIHIVWLEQNIFGTHEIYYMRLDSDAMVMDFDLVSQFPSIKRDLKIVVTTNDYGNPPLIPPGPGPMVIWSDMLNDYDIKYAYMHQTSFPHFWLSNPLVVLPNDQIKVSAKMDWDFTLMKDVLSLVFQTNNENPNDNNVGWRQYYFPTGFNFPELHRSLGIGISIDQELNPDLDTKIEPIGIFSYITWIRADPGNNAVVEYAYLDPWGQPNHYGYSFPCKVSKEFTWLAGLESRMYPKISYGIVGGMSQSTEVIQVDITWSGPETNDWVVFLTELTEDGRSVTVGKTKGIGGTGYYPVIESAKPRHPGSYEDYDTDGNFRMIYLEHYGGTPQNLFYSTTRKIFNYRWLDFPGSSPRTKPEMAIDEEGGLHIVYNHQESMQGQLYKTVNYAYWEGSSRPPTTPTYQGRISFGERNCRDPKIVCYEDSLTPDKIDLIILYFCEDWDPENYPNGEIVFVRLLIDSWGPPTPGPGGRLNTESTSNSYVEKNYEIAFNPMNGLFSVVYQYDHDEYGEEISMCMVSKLNELEFEFRPYYLNDGTDADEINPDIAIDAQGDEFFLFQCDNTIYFQALFNMGNSIVYFYYYDIQVSSTSDDCMYPQIELDREIHRVWLNNQLSDKVAKNWIYIHITYSIYDSELETYQIAYAKLRFTLLRDPQEHLIYFEDDVVLMNDMKIKSDDVASGREIDPSTVRLAMGYDNQLFVSYIVIETLIYGEETYYYKTPYYVKLDNNGYELDIGHQITQLNCNWISITAEWNGGFGLEIIISSTVSEVDELYRLWAY